MSEHREAIAAASAASDATSLLLNAVREDGEIEPEALAALVDATRLVIECRGSHAEDGQLLGALNKWLEENSL